MKSSTCWFCEKRAASSEDAYQVIMYGGVSQKSLTHKSWQTTWMNKTISVPQCTRCKTAQKWSTFSLVLGAILSVFAVVSILVRNPYSGWTWVAAILVGGITWPVVWGIGLVLISRVTGTKRWGVNAKAEYPAVKEAIKDGWKVGKKPPPT
jgi:hypothetical protein